jgi:hypothetical protein
MRFKNFFKETKITKSLNFQNKLYMSPQIISNNRVNDFSDNGDNRKAIIATSTNNEDNKLLPPTFDDMKQFAFILANITEFIDSSPELALSIASKEMGWLYARDVPKYGYLLSTYIYIYIYNFIINTYNIYFMYAYYI